MKHSDKERAVRAALVHAYYALSKTHINPSIISRVWTLSVKILYLPLHWGKFDEPKG